MWQAIQEVLTSDNFWKSVIGIGALIILFAVLVKKQLISFKGHGLSVGTAESERAIVRQQIEYVRTQAEIMSNQLINTFGDADEWRIRYICELIEDVWIDAISFNHLTRDSFYVENKFDKVWSIILRETVTEQFRNDKFKERIMNVCKEVVDKLVSIKEYYSK